MAEKVLSSCKPSIGITLVLLPLVLLFAGLGTWQLHRATQKTVLEQQFLVAQSMPLAEALQGDNRFAQVQADGHYDTQRHVLLDNQVWHGHAGVYVFTPFYLPGGSAILVNRGWLPMPPDRRTLPRVATPAQDIVLRGRLNTAPVPGRKLGPADQLDNSHWPQLVTYLDIADISAALGTALDQKIVQLSPGETSGFKGREWQPVFLTSKRHRAYAFQWFALSMACIVLWLFSGFRSAAPRHQARP